MSFQCIQSIPSPEEMKAEVSMSPALKKVKAEQDAALRRVFLGEDQRFLVIIGPCSASDEDAVCDYVSRLARINEEVKDKLFLVPRVYTNKPRTTGDGYKGMLHQPDPEKAPNIYEGIKALRKMHIRVIDESHMTAADEMLYPENLVFVDDILSYIAIGARSVENQQHRLVSSGIDVPVGMKNPTSGDFTVMLNAIHAAQNGHTFLYRDNEVETTGNPLAHAVIRGSVNKHGQSIPNYHYEDMRLLSDMYLEKGYENPFVVCDVSHANSRKIFSEQPRIVAEVLHSRKLSTDLHRLVRGIMVESYLVEGSQKVGEHVYGKSITDACIGWEDTEKLLYYMADHV